MTGHGPATAILGIDLGERRIGLALGEPASSRVRPLATIRRGDLGRDAETLRRICREHRVGEVLVGLPLDMDGSQGTQAQATLAWGSAMEGLLALPVAYRDERLSSRAAESRLGRVRRGASGGPPSRAALHAYRSRVDREAAAILLEQELEARRVGSPEPGPAASSEGERSSAEAQRS